MPDELEKTAVENDDNDNENKDNITSQKQADNPEPSIKDEAKLYSAYERVKQEKNQAKENARALQEKTEQLQQELDKLQSTLDEYPPEKLKQLEEEYLNSKNRQGEIIAAKQQEITELRTLLNQSQAELQSTRLNYELQDLFSQLGGLSGHFVAVKGILTERAKTDENGNLVIVGADGKIPFDKDKERNLTPKEVIERDFVQDTIWGAHFQGRQIGGSGTSSTGSTPPSTNDDIKKLSDPAEKLRIARERGLVRKTQA